MKLDTKAGEKIVFTGKGGYDFELENAKELLEVDCEYILSSIVVDSWSSAVELEEFPGEWFNSVHFKNVKK